jgi:CheY-like chemotaxis protein
LRFPAGQGVEASTRDQTPVLEASLRGRSLLLVEDDPDTRDLLVSVLSRHGAEVIALRDATEAIEACGDRAPDAIVSDIGLPDKDGYTLMRELRGRHGFAAPAVALTGFAGLQDAQRAIDAGFDVHLAKPINPYELVAKVAAILDAREQRSLS